MAPSKASYDCIVLGAGPAGSTAAALVSRAGFSTLLVERERMPREHVGESLMPETYWVFEKLGVLEKIKSGRFARKVGVQFVSNTGKESQPFFFRMHDPRECSETWHVERPQFDQILFENARDKGAECMDSARVLDVIAAGQRVAGIQLQTADGGTRDIPCKVVIDCTGQQSMLANKYGLKHVDPDLKKSSIWRHYRGAARDESGGGVKTIISHTRDKRAWFWYIPQADDLVSVGVVGDNDYLLKERLPPEQTFQEELQKCDGVRRRVEGAEPLDDLRVAKEFSYTTERSAGDGWVLAGDAWGFIDPVYSSGVYFAMKSADMAAECVINALENDDPSAARLGAWCAEFESGTKWVRKLVAAFYSGEFRVGKFAKEYPHHIPALTDLLIGRMFQPGVPELFADLDPWLEKMVQQSDGSAERV